MIQELLLAIATITGIRLTFSRKSFQWQLPDNDIAVAFYASRFNDTPHNLNLTSTLGFGFACDGDEMALSECRSQSPTLCTADRSNHIAIKCSGTATEANGADAATTSTQQGS